MALLRVIWLSGICLLAALQHVSRGGDDGFVYTSDHNLAMYQEGARAPRASSAAPSISARGGTAQRSPVSARRTNGFGSRAGDVVYHIGDFSSRPGAQVSLGELIGVGAHHTIASGSAFANDEISLVAFSAAQGKYSFVDIAGVTPGTFFIPSITPPAPAVIEDLSANATPDATYTAVANGSNADIFDNLANAAPSIPNAALYNIFEVTTFTLPSPNVADLVGRTRVQDNNAAVPRDRLFFDYSYFHNVPLAQPAVDVNRFVPGFETTFAEGLGSIEVRVPMGITLSTDVIVDAPLEASHYEFGNLMVVTKLLLVSDDEFALAGGLGASAPTSDDLVVSTANASPLLRISNESVHLIPFLAYSFSRRDSTFFSQGFLTLDVDPNGNTTSANATGDGLERIGVWNDQNLISVSGSIGQWFYEDRHARKGISGAAWTTELHYTATVNDADQLRAGPFVLGDPNADLSLLNATFGLHLRLPNGLVTTGYSVPLTSSDRIFDGELRVLLNRFF